VLAHLETTFSPGDIVPRVQVMAERLGLRRNDLDRVYSALVFDGVLEKVGRDYRLRGHPAARSTCYVPGHLR
jgi:DNA-binding transcriptional regulator YhcF (GntR family)